MARRISKEKAKRNARVYNRNWSLRRKLAEMKKELGVESYLQQKYDGRISEFTSSNLDDPNFPLTKEKLVRHNLLRTEIY
jgi:hypothetical protein